MPSVHSRDIRGITSRNAFERSLKPPPNTYVTKMPIQKQDKLGPAFGRTDFYFRAAGFFRGFSRRIFSPHFCGKKCPEKSSRKIPGKILQNLYYKNPPTHFCRLIKLHLQMTRFFVTLSSHFEFLGLLGGFIRDGPNTTTTIAFPKSLSSDATSKRHLIQEPLNAPFLNGLFSGGFSRGKTAP